MTRPVSPDPETGLPSISPAWVRATVFGALWGGLEVTLGAFLHALRLPLSGVWMAAAGIMILVSGLAVFPARGFLLRAGVVCMLLKLVSPGPALLVPMACILQEALVLELVAGGARPSAWRSALGGGVTTLSTLLQYIAAAWMIYGWDIIRIYYEVGRKILKWVNAPEDWLWWAIAAGIVLIFLIGLAAGALGFRLGVRVRRLREARHA